MGACRVALVIPVFNESKTIVGVINAVKKFGVPIVVDDGSTDDTASLALSTGAILVTHKKNLGYDSALNSGFKKANEIGVQIVITIDGDGQHNPDLIPEFIELLDLGADIVIGDRNNPQRVSEFFFSWYTKKLFGIRDPLCGLKAYRINVYKIVGHFDSYGSIGTELMLYCAKNCLNIKQLTFKVRNRRGKPRFGNVLLANWRIFRAMFLSFF